MKHLKNILRFGFPYLRPYGARFAVGLALGVLFGLSNALILGATDTLIQRLSNLAQPAAAALTAGADPVAASAPEATRGGISFAGQGSWRSRLSGSIQSGLDPWLPRLGRSLDWRQLAGGLMLFPLLGAFRGFASYLSSYCLAWVSEQVVNDLRLAVLRKLSGLSLDYFNRSATGDLLTRVNGDTASLQRCLNLGLSDLVKEPMTIASVLAGLCLLDWRMTVGAMVFLPLCVVPVLILGRKVRRAAHSGLRTNINQSNLLIETLAGIRMIKAFGLEDEQLERFRRLTREWFHFSMKGTRAKELVNPIIEVISLVGFGCLVVFIAAQGRTFADMATFLTGVALMYTPVKKLAGIHVLFEQTSVGVSRLIQVLAEKATVREPSQPKPLPRFQQAIEFDHVSFAYADRPVLRDLCLRIPAGAKMGVAGESGSGKSTLVNLIYRFYDPVAGVIRVDGLDLREVSTTELRRQLAIVSQEIVLFDLTVAENIARGRPGASQAEIEAAARAAFAHDFIGQLPQGYATRIGEGGVLLSGGQRQRLAIARAFVRNAPILVLDEATASLDAESEAEVQTAIERLEENRTVICVAHRLSTLATMDHIIVLADGRIAEEGSFAELLRRSGRFAAMAARQGMDGGASRQPAGIGV